MGEKNFGHDLQDFAISLCLRLKHSSFMLCRSNVTIDWRNADLFCVHSGALKRIHLFGKVPVQGYNVFGIVAQSKMQATQISFPIKPSTMKIHTVSFHLSCLQLRALFHPLKYYEWNIVLKGINYACFKLCDLINIFLVINLC